MKFKSRQQIEEAECFDEHGQLRESPENPPRFDAPISLEERGITQGRPGPIQSKQLEWYQQLIWSKATMHKNTVAVKLRMAGRNELAKTLEDCHTQYTIAKCKGCGKVEKFPNRCEHKICPECQPRLAADREKIVAWWLKTVTQPKLVTLTVKNVTDFSAGHVEEFQRWFRNLRNRKFCSNWTGGFYSLEVTKEGDDWHLHLHAIVDAVWIDQFQLSLEWKSVTNGQGFIVDVRRPTQRLPAKGEKIRGKRPTTCLLETGGNCHPG